MTVKKAKKKEQPLLQNEIAQKNLAKIYQRISDPNYSLFDNEYNNFKFMKRAVFSIIAIGLPLFIVGLIILIKKSVFGVIPLTFGALGVMMAVYLPIHFLEAKKFRTVLAAKKSKEPGKLLELAKKYSLSNSTFDQGVARLATFLLIDEKSLEIAALLKDRLSQRKPPGLKELLKAFHLLAIKLGYQTAMELFQALEKGSAKSQKAVLEDTEIVIPITKIYFLDHLPEKAKCMVSGLEIDFFVDEVVVCPYCSAFAKKALLATWLEDNSFCPVCRRELRIADCPIVQVSSGKK
ncbi:MAG: hypothetical protein K9W42_12830 [Candidatus Heimdallarchaeota archaeon]|nr:hypothetical protein [Candidatus Heimdallarchaeota archaeon]